MKPRPLVWFEEYRYGCVSEDAQRKTDLLGYCKTHGASRRNVYHWPSHRDVLDFENEEPIHIDP